MSYQKQNFANGEVLTAAQLNHIENGIADVESTASTTKGVVDKIIDPTLSVSGKAADAAKVGEAVGQVKEDIFNIEHDYADGNGMIRDYYTVEWSQGKFEITSGKKVTYTDATNRIHSNYIDVSSISTDEKIYLTVPYGYSVYLMAFDTNTDSYTNGSVMFNPAWATGGQTIEFTKTFKFANYFMLMALKVSADITPDDVSGIKMYVKGNSGLIKKLENVRMEYVSDEIDNKNIKKYDGYYINVNGSAVTTSASYSYTEDFLVYPGTIITIPAWDDDSDAICHLLIYKDGIRTPLVNAKDHRGKSVQVFINKETAARVSTKTSRIYDFTLTSTAISNVANKHDRDKLIDLVSSNVPVIGQILYEADNANDNSQIVNAVAYNDGTMIICRTNGVVSRIDYTGEHQLLDISGTNMDWRCAFMDSAENVYVSPHASSGTFTMSKRGLYRLKKGDSAFAKVLEFDNTTRHDDTIWTMCEDARGHLYAGLYSHSVRFHPWVYRSDDGGESWKVIYDFSSLDEKLAHHIHCIIYNKYNDALYCIVGEVNTVLKSTDFGEHWTNLEVELSAKGTSMLATPYGVLIGSDGYYNCDIYMLANDDKTATLVHHGWASTVFAIRNSDISGIIYAFTKIDSSVKSSSLFPPADVLLMPDPQEGIEAWKNTVQTYQYNLWKRYYDSCVEKYPEDAIRPTHYAILVSRDGGMHWDILHKFDTDSTHASGFWTTGYFRNGECLTGHKNDSGFVKPIVISEGKHKYTSTGIDLSGEIFVKTNSSSIVSAI